jgi:hypothetical protein
MGPSVSAPLTLGLLAVAEVVIVVVAYRAFRRVWLSWNLPAQADEGGKRQ